jgi:uncharacterized protein YggE
VTKEAIHAWQQRAQAAASEFGASSWRPGRIAIQGNEPMRPQPMLRAQATAISGAAPVAVEAGTTDVSVSVSGEVIVETVRAPTR